MKSISINIQNMRKNVVLKMEYSRVHTDSGVICKKDFVVAILTDCALAKSDKYRIHRYVRTETKPDLTDRQIATYKDLFTARLNSEGKSERGKHD